jgi:hypothetical protein
MQKRGRQSEETWREVITKKPQEEAITKKIKPQKEAVKRNLERRSLGKIEKKKGQKIERMGERKGEKEPEKHNTKARGRRNKEE